MPDRSAPMKIAYLSQAGAIGGAERVLLDTIESVLTVNPEWELGLIAAADGPVIAAARDHGVVAKALPFPLALAELGDAAGTQGRSMCLRLGRLGVSSPTVLAYAKQLEQVLTAFDPDVVHANGFKMHILGAYAAPKHTALLWHVHDFVGARPIMRRLLRAYAPRCSVIVANSRSVANDLREALGAGTRIAVVYNAVDLTRFAPVGKLLDLDGLSGLDAAPSNTVRAGLVATGAHWKGHTTFLQALALLPSDLPVRGYVIGGPIYQTRDSQILLSELRSEAVRLGITNRVGFTGYQADIASAMRALDFVVHASIAPEPFGLVIAEAFASGRAVISTGWGGAGEIIDPENNAITHGAGDASSLAAAIKRLATDASLRDRLGRAGRVTAAKQFDRNRLGAEFSSIYQSILSSNEGDAAAARS